eukprot:TRINITY_DN109889_c0_g1_i1.p1 TRINITY_DN109889_c0_g1~~TRINITY_DN109889_c0_g1_i1.p1  ORF type:complete len:673 (-),score=229.17 TRINITY_DN109889_c0_g1_i1:134-2152(-)
MKPVVGSAFTFLALASGASAKARSEIDSPSQKVVDLLLKVEDDVKREGKVEETQFSRYAEFCRQTEDDKTYAISKGGKAIKRLTAEIGTLTADSAALDAEVKTAEDAATALQKEIDDAVAARAETKEEYDTEAKDMNAAIVALYKAIQELKQQKGNLKGNVKSLAQVSSVASDVIDTVTRISLVGVSETHLNFLGRLAKPEVGKAADYNYKSNDIIQMMQDLRATFKENRQQLDMAEMESKNAHDLKVSGLTKEKELKNQEKAEKTLSSSEKKARKAAAEKEKTDKEKVKTDDEKFLSDLQKDCKAKADQSKQRSTVREGELEALAKAIDKLKAGTDAELIQTRETSFLQLVDTAESERLRAKAISLLDKTALRNGETALSILALKMRALAPNLEGTVKLVKDLIKNLEKEGEDAKAKKEACDKEIADSSANLQKLIKKHESLLAVNEAKTSERNEKVKDATDLNNEIAALKKTLKEATAIRISEKAENAVTLAEAKEGSGACEYAIKVLKEFYESVGGLSFIQKRKEAPEAIKKVAPKFTIEEGDYKGSEGGVVGEVQKLKDEMDKTVTDTEAAEKKAEEDFTKLSDETDESVEAKTTEMKDALKAAETLKGELLDNQEETEETKKASEAANAQTEHVKAKCDNGGVSFAAQEKMRETEIEDLNTIIKQLE